MAHPSAHRLIPDCKVSADGKRLALEKDAALVSVNVDLDLELFGQCVLTFNDPKLQLINGTDFKSGTAVKVEIGFHTRLKKIFEGEVVALEPIFRRDTPPSLKVICQESLHRLALSQMTRAFNDVDDKQIATRIAQEHGLTAQAPSGTKEHILQANVTDAAFLRRIAAKSGHTRRIEGKKLIIGPPPRGANVQVSPGDGLTKIKVRIKANTQVSEVTVHGWDSKTKKEIVGKAKPSGEIQQGAQDHGNNSTLSIAGLEYLPADVATAEAMAKGRLAKIAERFIEAHGEMVGNPDVLPGAVLNLEKMGEKIDGLYRVGHATHAFSKFGYVVKFDAVRIGKAKPPRPPIRPQPPPQQPRPTPPPNAADRISFWRVLDDATAGAQPQELPVAVALDGGVVARLHQFQRRPLPSELVSVRAPAGISSVTLQTGRGTATVAMRAGGGGAESQKKLLFWYGDSPSGAQWDDLQLVEVSASGDAPFATTLHASSGAARGDLGLLDVLAEDPDAPGTWRTLRHGLFRTRGPTLRFVLPNLQLQDVRVFLDDGDDATDDELDITGLLHLSGPVTTVQLPQYVRLSGAVRGLTNRAGGRDRVFRQSAERPPEEGNVGLFVFGENRLRVEKGRGATAQKLFTAYSLHYLDRAQTVPAGNGEIESAVGGGRYGGGDYKNSLTLDFTDGAADAAISRVLQALRLKPVSYVGRHRILEGRVLESRSGEQMEQLKQQIDGFHDQLISGVGRTPALPLARGESGFQERLPAAFLGDYSAANHTFTTAAEMHWHHFVLHTFSAHRLIESRILPENRPAQVSVAGAHFQTNSTFLRPSVEPDIHRIQTFDSQNAGKKIAIFGHTDSVGSDPHNNQLSLRRARSMEALLRHNLGFGYDRFDGTGRKLGPGAADRQWALHELGHYNGPLDGNRTVALDAAEAAFRGAHPGTGGGDTALRQAIADELRRRIGAVREPLTNENRWGDDEMRQMLHRLGFDGALPTAVRNFQQSRHLTADGAAGVATWIELIRHYQNALLPTALADARFHAGAVFGCGKAFPAMPLGDNRESAQNRRVEVVFRTEAVQPVNNALLGNAVPYLDWLAPEVDLAAPANTPTVVVAITDTGFGRGNADNWSGDHSRETNPLQIRGERWVRPTNTNGAGPNPAGTAVSNLTPAVVNPDGDLRNVNDGPAGSGSGHGTAVATCLGAEAPVEIGGTALGPASAVLGTAPHVKIRAIQAMGSIFSVFQAQEIIAADPEVKVHTTSLGFPAFQVRFTAKVRRAFQERVQEMVMAGKLGFAVPQNYNGNPIAAGGNPGVYHSSTTQWGSIAGDRRNPRSTFSGANEYQQHLAIIGASKRMGLTLHPIAAAFGPSLNPGQFETATAFSYIGEQVTLHTPGEQVRAIAPSGTSEASPPGFGTQSPAAVGAGLTIGNTDGTSFATPMTAGIAAELMLVDPTLQQPANVVRVLEYLEATADPLPPLNPNGGEVWGPTLAPRVNDPTIAGNVNHPAFSNIRRTHFWKAVLAALNGGLSSEGRTNNGGKDSFFTNCDLKDDGATAWYGFELRTLFPDAVVWFRKPGGELVEASDGGALFPSNRIIGSAWICTDAYDAPVSAAPGAARFVLAAFPWTPATLTGAGRTPYFMAQLSIEKARLADYEAIVLHLPAVDPRVSDDPPAVEIRVADRPTLRNKSSIPAGAPEAFKQAILIHLDAFDDFVFHITQKVRPLAGFRIVAPHRRSVINVGEDIEVLVYAVDAQGFLTNQGPASVTVTHNGGGSVSFNGAVVPQAGAAVNFGAGTDPRALARLRLRDGAAEALTITINDGTHPAATLTLTVQSATAAHGFELTLRRRGGAAIDDSHPAHAAEELELEVRAVDQGNTFTGFTGEVHLAVEQGEVGSTAAQRRGVHLKTHAADAFTVAAFTHTFAAAEQGVHVFPLIDFSSGALQMRAESGVLSGLSQIAQMQGGAASSLRVQASTPQTAGNGFDVMVSALDATGNVVEDFTGTVTLARLAGTAPAVGPPRQGVFVSDTATPNDDSHDFVASDHGIFRFHVSGFTVEPIRLRATAPGLTQGDSPNIQVQAGVVAPARFQIDVIGASQAGQPFSVRVTAVDVQGRRLTGFSGNVQLSVIGAGAVAPPPAVNPPSHVYAAVDQGAFTFSVTSQRVASFQVQATSGVVTTQSAVINIVSGPLDHFQLQAPASVHRNAPFDVRVTANDQFNNVIANFLGNVQVQPAAGGAALASHAFAVADHGTFRFSIQLGTLGVQQVSATDQNFINNSGNINVVP